MQFCPRLLPFQGLLTALEALKAFSFLFYFPGTQRTGRSSFTFFLPLQSEQRPHLLWVAWLLWRGWWLISCFYPELHHRNLALFIAIPALLPLSRVPRWAVHFTCQQKCCSTPSLDGKHTNGIKQRKCVWLGSITWIKTTSLLSDKLPIAKVIIGICHVRFWKAHLWKIESNFKGGFVS